MFSELHWTVSEQLWQLVNQTRDIPDNNNIYESMKRYFDLCKDEGKEIEKTISGEIGVPSVL